ncbi:hypothetical protein [Actinomadura sp. 3N407]|uniref:hypothetical protein n=1 Tax=Actinomadura sp. 3N407 TaxID=3457423 RepID=UPI003FCCEFDF
MLDRLRYEYAVTQTPGRAEESLAGDLAEQVVDRAEPVAGLIGPPLPERPPTSDRMMVAGVGYINPPHTALARGGAVFRPVRSAGRRR